MDDRKHAGRSSISRRNFVAGAAALGASGLALPAWAQKTSSRTGTVRVWGEPGPYAGVAVDAMNEWAKKFAPGITFKLETLSWDGVYVKLMTDLAAKNPAHCISVESPIAYQLMADLLLEPLDDVVQKVGRNRLVDGVKWEYWGAWKGKQYVLPAHHQATQMVVRTDIVQELGLGDPDKWSWDDMRNAAKAITEKKRDVAGISLALGRNLCTDYHFASLLHSAGGRMFAPENKFEVVFDSPATVDALEYVKSLQPYMPRGAVSYSFLEVVDSIVTGRAGISFYWGRPYGRAAEENKVVFAALQSYNHPRHPKTGRRSNWNDFQGWCIPKPNNQYIDEVKAALAYYQTGTEWMVRYCHSLMPNVSPVYKDVLNDPKLMTHPFFQTKRETIMNYYVNSLAHSSSTGNEMLKGINPLAGIVHGRSILAQTVQKVVVDNWKAADAAKWGARELEGIRKSNLRLLGGMA